MPQRTVTTHTYWQWFMLLCPTREEGRVWVWGVFAPRGFGIGRRRGEVWGSTGWDEEKCHGQNLQLHHETELHLCSYSNDGESVHPQMVCYGISGAGWRCISVSYYSWISGRISLKKNKTKSTCSCSWNIPSIMTACTIKHILLPTMLHIKVTVFLYMCYVFQTFSVSEVVLATLAKKKKKKVIYKK